jgi:hypothetical protein
LAAFIGAQLCGDLRSGRPLRFQTNATQERIIGMRLISTAVVATLLTSCGAGTAAGSAARLSLTFQKSVNGAAPSAIPAQGGLDLPNVGDVGVVTAFENNQQVSFSLTAAPACTNVVTISPSTSSLQQTVTAVANGGQCTAKAEAQDGTTAALSIFALPPP